jgi:hypothetical protein
MSFVLTADYDGLLPDKDMDDAFGDCVRMFDGEHTVSSVRGLKADFEDMVSPEFACLEQMLLDHGFKNIFWYVECPQGYCADDDDDLESFRALADG